MSKHFKNVIFVSVKPFATAPGTVKGCVTVRDFTRRRVHCFRRRTFWAFVVNCDLKNHTSSAVTKVGKCTADVLQYVSWMWGITQWQYLFLNVIFQQTQKPHTSGHMLKRNFFFVLMWRTHPWSMPKHFNTPCTKPVFTSSRVNPVSTTRTDLLLLLGNNQCWQQGS